MFEFRKLKRLADGALEQIDERDWYRPASDHDSEDRGNEIAVLVKHVAGNLRSRWTDFLTTDGEKPDRHRDQEFVVDQDSISTLNQQWDAGWSTLFETLQSLEAADLAQEVKIRGEPHRVSQAILRQLTHYGYHVGQIVQRARSLVGDRWTSLSIPRGQSPSWSRGQYLGGSNPDPTRPKNGSI